MTDKLLSEQSKYLRITALAMFGPMILCCFAFVLLTPLWYGMTDPDVMLMIGGVVMLLAIPLHLLGGAETVISGSWRRWFYLLVILINTVGTSICEAAYYTHIGVRPPVNDLLAGALIPAGVCLLFALVAFLLPRRWWSLSVIFGVLTVGLIVLCTVLWVQAGLTARSVLWSCGLFNLVNLLIVEIAHYFAASEITDELEKADEDTRPALRWTWMRYLSFASFSLLMIVGAIVLIILMCAGGDCDCDCDCCDCSGSGSSKKKARKKVK